METSVQPQLDLLVTEQLHWSSWGLRALLKSMSVVVMASADRLHPDLSCPYNSRV